MAASPNYIGLRLCKFFYNKNHNKKDDLIEMRNIMWSVFQSQSSKSLKPNDIMKFEFDDLVDLDDLLENNKEIFKKIMNQSKIIKGLITQAPKIIDIFPIIAPKGSPSEYATYNTISAIPFNSKTGFTNWHSRVQIDLYAESYARVSELAGLVINRLVGTNKVVLGINVQEIELINVIDGFNQNAEENGIFRIITEFLIYHE